MKMTRKNNESDNKPPSIPSARTDEQRAMSSIAPTSEDTDMIDSFISSEGVKYR